MNDVTCCANTNSERVGNTCVTVTGYKVPEKKNYALFFHDRLLSLHRLWEGNSWCLSRLFDTTLSENIGEHRVTSRQQAAREIFSLAASKIF